jgi:DNA modification methylase
MKVQRLPIGTLKPNPDNPRLIKDEKFKKLVASIRSLPAMLELRPIVVNADLMVLGGNMRLKACQAAGLTEVPVVIADELTEAQQAEFVIKDNVSFGEWEWDTLANAWDANDLSAWGLDVPSADVEVTVGLTDPDEVPDAPKEPITKRGDRIVLGRHTLVCGDSTDAGAWDALLAGRQAGMVWTDPPYGVSYGEKNAMLNKRDGGSRLETPIESDSLDAEGLQRFLRSALSLAWANTRNGGSWYVAAPPGLPLYEFATVLRELEVWRHTLAWVKDGFVLGRCDYHYRHETIFYGWKDGAAHLWNGGRSQDSVLEIPRPRVNKEHPTMKPIALIQRCIENSSNADDLIVDPFGGSGSTMLAAHTVGRASALIELDPRYCDVIVRRWEEFTGQKAVRPLL